MTIPARVISLHPPTTHALNLVATLQEGGFDAQLSPGVDGRQGYPALEGDEELAVLKGLFTRRAKLTSSEVGVYLSHYRLIKQAYSDGLSHLCIFEDDAVPEPGLLAVLNEIEKLDKNAHLVRLMSLKTRRRKIIKPLTDEHKLIRPVRGALGAQGYVINREGMKIVLDQGAKIAVPLDTFYDGFFLIGLNCYSVEPHSIYEADTESTVAKTGKTHDRRLWVWLGFRFVKLYRSLMRRWFYITNFKEFFPAQMPEGFVGRSKRIRQ